MMDKENGTDQNGQNNGNNGNNGNNNGNTPDANALKVLSSRNMSTVSLIAAPVSLFLGGVFLSIVALVFGIVALVKVTSVMHDGAEQDPYARIMRMRAFTGIGISLLALVLNAYALVIVMPMIMELFNGGSLDDIIASLNESMANGTTAAPDGSRSNSVFG